MDKDAHTPAPSYELRILEALRRIIRATDLHSRQLLLRYRITTPQLVALRLVGERDGMTVSGLSRRMHVSASTVVGILNRLEERGLLERRRNGRDRRLVYVAVTRAGLELIEEAPSPLQTRLAEGLGRLPELEQATIGMALERVVDLMEVGELDSSPMLERGATLERAIDERRPDVIAGELRDDSAARIDAADERKAARRGEKSDEELRQRPLEQSEREEEAP